MYVRTRSICSRNTAHGPGSLGLRKDGRGRGCCCVIVRSLGVGKRLGTGSVRSIEGGKHLRAVLRIRALSWSFAKGPKALCSWTREALDPSGYVLNVSPFQKHPSHQPFHTCA